MAEIDIKYLREKNVPTLMEKIAADIVARKPADPEAFLREKYAMGDEGQPKRGDNARVFGVKLDPGTGTVLMACAYVGITPAMTEVDPSIATADFTTVSPLKRYPVLDHQGIVTVEVGAATRYIAHATGALPLAPRVRGGIESAFEVIQNSVNADATTAANERVFTPTRSARPVDHVAVSAAAERYKVNLAQLEAMYFKESEWVVGKEPSIADMSLASAIFTFQHVIGIDAVEGRPIIAKFWNAVQQQKFFSDSMKGFTAAAVAIQR